MAAAYTTYIWQSYDTIWRVAGRLLGPAGYTDVSTFVEDIRAANPQILDWRQIPGISITAGTVIVIPHAVT